MDNVDAEVVRRWGSCGEGVRVSTRLRVVFPREWPWIRWEKGFARMCESESFSSTKGLGTRTRVESRVE